MKNFIHFIQDFIKNKGIYVFASLLLLKISAFVTQIIITRLIPKEDYGFIVYHLSILSFFIPIVGVATYQGLIRFASIEKNEVEKNKIYSYAFWKGLQFQLIINSIFTLIYLFYAKQNPYYYYIIVFFNILLIGYFFQYNIQSNFRAQFNNKKFALSSITLTLFGLLCTVFLTYLYQIKGYIIALGLSPFILLLFLSKKEIFTSYANLKLNKKAFWNYNLYSSLAIIIPEFVFATDILLANYYFNNDMVANYKILIILPFNLWFFPQVFLQTDYPKLCANIKNKLFILNYAKNFSKLFIIIGLLIITLSYIYKDSLIPYLFGKQYEGGILFVYIVIAVIFSWFTKTLCSHLIGAMGKNNINFYIGLFSLLLLLISSYFLIPIFNYNGLVYSVIISLVGSSLITILIYIYIFKNEYTK